MYYEYRFDDINDSLSDITISIQQINKVIEENKKLSNDERLFLSDDHYERIMEELDNIRVQLKDVSWDIQDVNDDYNGDYDDGYTAAEEDLKCNYIVFPKNKFYNQIESEILLNVLEQVTQFNSLEKVENKLKELL